MAYLLMNVNHTVADLSSLFYYLASLTPWETVRLGALPFPEMGPVAEELKRTTYIAYKEFVAHLVEEESSDDPIGILRPGILSIMTRIRHLQGQGVIKGIVFYSNQPYRAAIHVIRDIIHYHLDIDEASPLILECITTDHTWGNVQKVLSDREGRQVLSQEVYGVDDQVRPDLRAHLGENFLRVASYRYRASADRLAAIYQAAIRLAGVQVEHLAQMAFFLFSKAIPKGALEGLMPFLKERTGHTASEHHLPLSTRDRGIICIQAWIERIVENGLLSFPV